MKIICRLTKNLDRFKRRQKKQTFIKKLTKKIN